MKSFHGKIQMVDLKGQYCRLKSEIDAAISGVIESTSFINGPEVSAFTAGLEKYTGSGHVVTCANGTDALQIALMSLGLEKGDEILVPAFTYVASAEVIALLGLVPVLVDVDRDTFNISCASMEEAWSDRCRAVIPVHLFGQSADMERILSFASDKGLYVIEDNAQSFSALCHFSDGTSHMTGTMGNIGCTSFFPSKILGCYGDGGALFTDDDSLASRIRMIANHGQRIKYHHDITGCNSRLDSIQAAILRVKLSHIDEAISARRKAAEFYDKAFESLDEVRIPYRAPYSDHVFHQYTLVVKEGPAVRERLRVFLESKGIPSMIYYPLPLHKQKAFEKTAVLRTALDNSCVLSESVLSIPIHTEMSDGIIEYIAENVREFFGK